MTSRRFESIGGILNRTAVAPEAQSDEVPKAPAQRSQPATSATRPRTATARPSRTHSDDADTRASTKSDGGVRRIAFRLDPQLHDALTTRAATNKISQGQLVLDYVEVAHQTGVLADLVAAERDQLQTDGLFPRLRTRTTAQATVPVEIRLHAQAAEVLDKLVDQTEAESRTQLITAVLRQSLT